MSDRGYILRVAEEGVVFLANLDGATTELYRNHVLATSIPKISNYTNYSTQFRAIQRIVGI